MEVFKIKGILTKEDVAKINEIMPTVVEIATTKGQDPALIASLSPKIKIRIKDDVEEKIEEKKQDVLKKDYYEDETFYSPEELASVITSFQEIEKGIDPSFSDVDAALYTYMELIKRISPISIHELQKNDNLIDNNTLLALTKQRAFPTGFAKIYQEAMRRLGIPCKIITGDNGYAWNEIEVNGTYYPLDLTYDAAYYRSEDAKGELGICKFLTDKEFYFDPLHKTSAYSEEELKKIRALEDGEIGKSLEKIEYARRKREREIKPELKITSKTLSEVVKGGVLTPETASEIETLKISVTNEEAKAIAADLAEIGKHYPEVLENVELENTTGAKVDMQAVVDSIYESRAEAERLGRELAPIEITISSSNAGDFDLDFSNAPENSDTFTDEDRKPKITLRNLGSTAMGITNLNGKITKNIYELELDGFDLNGLDLSGSGIKRLKLTSEKTENLDGLSGFEELDGIAFESTDPTVVFSRWADIISATSNIHDVDISGVDLHDRKILQELVQNPNLVRLSLENCRINDIDGLESFDGRIAFLSLYGNDLTVDDIERINRFWDNNPYASIYANSNSNFLNAIRNARRISPESRQMMLDFFYESGTTGMLNEVDCVNRLMWSSPDVPYVIKDADVIRGELKITRNPIMLENDSDLDTVDFTASHLQGATLLLTIPQVERLIASGKTIPQNVRVRIENVSELSAQKARDLVTQMNNNGMNLTGVQIFDDEKANRPNQIAPYSMAEYVASREILDRVVSGINPTDSDIDKFAVIYERLKENIVYNTPACNHGDRAQAMYYAEKRNSSRNLLDGLTEGTCVCAGYSDILRNALDLVGIESRIVSGWGRASNPKSYHAWNQVCLDDGTGTKRWYNTDLTWDAGSHSYDETLRGNAVFCRGKHDKIRSRNIATAETNDFDRALLRDAFNRARGMNFDYRNSVTIDIPEDPTIPVEIPDPDRIAAEYARRKDDMYAKFYGDRDYQAEYEERNARFRDHEVERIDSNGRTYRVIEDYAEREEDEKFLLLDKYSDALERMTKYEAGDTSVYQGTQDQIDAQLERDREYVESRNHTFDQHKNTYKDLATLGKYGERMPYIQRQPGVLRNIGRVVGNVGIFARNLVAPVYRAIGRFVAQPLHRLITRGRDASPYRNNFYHRMVARRDYFAAENEAQNPGHPFRTFVKSRVDAIFKAAEGNEAVLRAGAADIRKDIVDHERANAVIENYERRVSAFDAQIQSLEQQLIANPHPSNEAQVRQAIANKTAERDRLRDSIENYRRNETGMAQTDAISDKQHAVASKEVNTLRVTVIKGVAKGVATKLIGPKIKDWLLERGKTTETVDVTIQEEVTKERWVDTTYKTESTPIYDEVIDSDASLSDIMASNEGKSVTGFYSVYGGERGGKLYELTGNEKITAIFQAKGRGGTGLSDTAGLTAPTLTDRVFSSNLLNANGVLNQDISLNELVEGLSTGNIDASAFGDMYVSVGDRCWVKLSDLVGDVTKKIQIGEDIRQVVDVSGHMETYTELVDKVIQTTKVVTDPRFQTAVNVGGKVAKGAMVADGVVDVAENLRRTTTDTAENKRQPRDYTFDVDVDDIPRSRREYRDRER